LLNLAFLYSIPAVILLEVEEDRQILEAEEDLSFLKMAVGVEVVLLHHYQAVGVVVAVHLQYEGVEVVQECSILVVVAGAEVYLVPATAEVVEVVEEYWMRAEVVEVVEVAVEYWMRVEVVVVEVLEY
jgi:hypothetical protein